MVLSIGNVLCTIRSIPFQILQKSNVQSSGPVSTQGKVDARICGNLDQTLERKSDEGQAQGICTLTSGDIIRYPEHVRYNCNKDKIVKVELRRPPFRGLGNWSATVVCPHARSRNRIISFGIRSCILSPAVYHCLVWRAR